jgi:hypothetical protein
MRSLFPGMDPYLEKHWRDVHASLIIYARDQLQRQLPQQLFARVEERVFVESEEGQRRPTYPDVRVVEHSKAPGSSPALGGLAVAEPVVVYYAPEPVTETYLEVIDAESGKRVVTVIEFLSLSNKTPGDGQDLFRRKQREMKRGGVNLVEIDLLRDGERVLSLPGPHIPAHLRTPYQACVWRAVKPDQFDVYPVPLRQALPPLRIPLRQADADIRLDLQELLDLAYENGRYSQTIDYTAEPEPPLGEDDAIWADDLLRAAGKRT